MPQWEYQIVRVDWFQNAISALRPQGHASVPLAVYLNEAGASGWEVVGMQTLATIPDTGKLFIILKRPRDA